MCWCVSGKSNFEAASVKELGVILYVGKSEFGVVCEERVDPCVWPVVENEVLYKLGNLQIALSVYPAIVSCGTVEAVVLNEAECGERGCGSSAQLVACDDQVCSILV